MKDVIFFRNRVIRSVVALIFSFVFTFYTIFSLPLFSSRISAAPSMGGSVESWRFDSNEWVNANSKTATEAEGEWLPVQAKLTGIQSSHPGLAGLVYEIEFTFTKNGVRFFDAIRSVQVSDKITDTGSKLIYPLNNPDYAYPDANGNAMDLSSRNLIESAQNNPVDYWWDRTTTGFVPIRFGADLDSSGVVGDIPSEVPITQLNVPLASDINDEPGEKSIYGVPGFSFDDDTHRFYVTGEQLVALGINPNADNLVMYFQLHLARTSVWSQGNIRYFATKYMHGSSIYDKEPYLSSDDPTVDNSIEINSCNGAGYAPGASSHVSFGPSTGVGNAQIQYPPISPPTGTISGYKFEDVNADGVWNPLGVDGIVSSDDEKPLASWPVSLVAAIAGIYVPLYTVNTDANGMYTFSNLTNDIKYYICEDPGSMEMFQTYPLSGSTPGSDQNPSAPAVSGVRVFDLRGNPAVTPTPAPAELTNPTDQEIASYVQYALNQGVQNSGNPIEWARWAWEVRLPFDPSGDGTLSQTNIDFGNSITPPSVQISKNANKDSVPESGENVLFTYKIANPGLSAITITALNDDKFGNLLDDAETAWVLAGHTAPIVLAPGAEFSFTYMSFLSSDTLTSHTNVVNVTAQDVRGESVTASATDTVTFTDVLPTVSLTKNVAPVSRLEPGGNFDYTISVTNNSIESVTITAFTDSDSGAAAILAARIGSVLTPGQTITIPYTLSYINAGVYNNTASITVRDNEGNSASDSDTETVRVEDVLPVIDIVKTASPVVLPEPGGTFTYTVSLTNNSVEPVVITSLTDSNTAASAVLSAHVGDTIAAGATVSYNYTESYDDAGIYRNTASVTVRDNENNTASDSDTETVTITNSKPVVDIQKTATPKLLNEPGGTFTYNIVITNSGQEDFTITDITDNNAAAAAVIAANEGKVLKAGESITLTYTDVHNHAGTFPNTASVSVIDDDGSTANDFDTETVSVADVLPTVDVSKTANVLSIPQPGGTVTYTIVVTNYSPENVTITSIADTNPTGNTALQALVGQPLTPGASRTMTYDVTYTGVNDYTNTVTVAVRDDEKNIATDSDSETVTVTDGKPSVDITKTVDVHSRPEPGGLFTYTVKVTNVCPENITITDLTDTIPAAVAVMSPHIGEVLAPGASFTMTYSATYTDKGTYANTATVVARDDQLNSVTDSDIETVNITDTLPFVSIVKTAGTLSMSEPGGNFPFRLVITNESYEAVTISSLTDSSPGTTALLSGYFGQTMAPGVKITIDYTVPYTESGIYKNTAMVVVMDNEGNYASDSDDENVTVRDVLPSVDIEKTCLTPRLQEPGGSFTYTVTVTNIGVEAFTITKITDTNTEAKTEIDKLLNVSLMPGESRTVTYTAVHNEAGNFPNLAEVTVSDNENNIVTKNENEIVDVIDELPVISITKTANPLLRAEPGGVFNYTITITNASVESVTITALTDTNSQAALLLAPYIGATMTPGQVITINYPITYTESGSYSNTASVTVKDNENNFATDTDAETVTVGDSIPIVDIKKSVSSVSMTEPGGIFTYTLIITNAGVEGFVITDLTDTNPEAASAIAPYIGSTLAAGASITVTYTASHTHAGVYNNTATVLVTDNEKNTATDSDSETVTIRDSLPDINMVKTVDDDQKAEPGGDFNYTLVISNNGVEEVTVTKLTDTMPAAAALISKYVGSTIAAGKELTIKYTLPFYHAGVYNNTASVTVQDNEQNELSDTDSQIVTVTDVPPVITIDKLGAQLAVTPGVGAEFQFTLTVTNISVEAVTITGFTDSNPTINTMLAEYIGRTMAPQETITVVYTTIQTLAGEYANTASIVVNDNENNQATDSDTVVVIVTETEALIIARTGDSNNMDILLILLGCSVLMFALPMKKYIFKNKSEV